LFAGTLGCALEQQFALPAVTGQRRSSLELDSCLLQASELVEKIAAHAGKKMVILECGFLL
jgi:hypothetical protein